MSIKKELVEGLVEEPLDSMGKRQGNGPIERTGEDTITKDGRKIEGDDGEGKERGEEREEKEKQRNTQDKKKLGEEGFGGEQKTAQDGKDEKEGEERRQEEEAEGSAAEAPPPQEPPAEEQIVFSEGTCPACRARLQYPQDSELVECCVCLTVSPVDPDTFTIFSSTSFDSEAPLVEQCKEWTPMQVSVFLASLGLPHIARVFEGAHIDGHQLLDLTEEDLRVEFAQDVKQVFAAINILRTTPSPDQDEGKQGGGGKQVGKGGSGAAAPMEVEGKTERVPMVVETRDGQTQKSEEAKGESVDARAERFGEEQGNQGTSVEGGTMEVMGGSVEGRGVERESAKGGTTKIKTEPPALTPSATAPAPTASLTSSLIASFSLSSSSNVSLSGSSSASFSSTFPPSSSP